MKVGAADVAVTTGSSASSEASRSEAWCAIGVAAVTLLHVAYYFPRVVDDLFISLRCAENLAQGRGAVYNVGERVEGFSSPLWMLLQSSGIALGLEAISWTKLLGVGSLLWLEWSLFRLTREGFGVRGWLAWLPALACATNSYVVNWGVLGLETPLHLALLAAAPLALQAGLERRSRVRANLVLSALGLSRPESLAYLLATLAAPLAFVRTRASARQLLARVARTVWPTLVFLGAALLFRVAYYGRGVPNTSSVKAGVHFFDPSHLAPLVSQGVGVAEALVYLAGTALLVVEGYRHRFFGPALYALGCLCFTALVKLDWMPSLRHLLPVTVLAPVGLVSFAATAWGAHPRAALVNRSAVVGLLLLSMATVLRVDNRNSPEEKRGRGWIRPKQLAKWRDTVLAYRRIEPPHVLEMRDYEMGQITQVWHVLEASAAPIGDSWFVGRDIGVVGYFTDVRVFDTAGLFTPAVSRSSEWITQGRVSDELIETAMSLHPLAGEIYEGWERALGRHPELLQGYRIRRGDARAPVAFLATDRTKPERSVVLERYRRMLAKFPSLYHLHTLYGESVGAAAEKRQRVVLGRR